MVGGNCHGNWIFTVVWILLKMLQSCIVLFIYFFLVGGNCEDHEDAKEDHQRPTPNWARRDPEEHVPSTEEDDQRTNRVANRTQIYEERWEQYQHVYLPSLRERWRGIRVPARLNEALCGKIDFEFWTKI